MEAEKNTTSNNNAVNVPRLEPTEKDQNSQKRDDIDARIARIDFRCSGCYMHELVHYFGREPPFALGIRYKEDNYVLRDPFQPPPQAGRPVPEYYISMGSKCSSCLKIVCKSSGCSFYYTATFCVPCGKSKLKDWPVDAQTRFRKQLSANQSD
ncbi:cysteine-rich DPF motif domain-containing protein 1 [Drosophila bipectinata]|uniref:cysteine-rich DPF motif domain-containing protein 1 n=1 Tax=Drosophila bipectinata TaxID=42026 RepID=UPI001C896EEF|nr:cysteine-rich DPF motif domain-containing protein 1 [Drosophila bipectinata]